MLLQIQDKALLEWLDDVTLWLRKGPSTCIASHMALPLVQHVRAELSAACQRAQQDTPGGPSLSLAFAHAETLIPLASMLGLFGSPGPCSLDDGSLPLYTVRPGLCALLHFHSNPCCKLHSQALHSWS